MSRGIYLFLSLSAVLIVCFVLLLLGIWPENKALINNTDNFKTITVGSASLQVEVADNAIKLLQGLSNRLSLPENQGMLFVFEQSDTHSFWMKGMQFPLDFIWIDGNQVVEIAKNVPSPATPGDNPVVLKPKKFVDRVLEVNAGWVSKNNIKIGDRVSYP